jgi:sugar lactone lactonase YvrE
MNQLRFAHRPDYHCAFRLIAKALHGVSRTGPLAVDCLPAKSALPRWAWALAAPAILIMICALLGASAHGQMVIPSVPGDITTTAGFWNGVGYTGPATGAILSPYAVAVDTAGNIYIADGNGNDIRRVSAATGNIATVAGNGTLGYSGDGGLAINAELKDPSGIALDAAGNIYIADSENAVIRKVTAATGIITTVAGGGSCGSSYCGDGGLATSARFASTAGVALDASGNIYISDNNSNVIREVKASTGIIGTVAGNGNRGYSGDGGIATSSMLSEPEGVALDVAGNLYIADWGNNVIRKVTAATGIISTVAGNGKYGFSGDGGPATSAELWDTSGIALDGLGNLYIADLGNNVIRKVAAATGIIGTVAGNGYQGYSGDGGSAANATLYRPGGVALDPDSNLYIADTSNSVIRKVTASTGIINTVAGGGPCGSNSCGDGGPATEAELRTWGVALDAPGNLYISDTNVIRKVTAATGIISTVAGNGTRGYCGDTGLATSAELGGPMGIALDPAGNLYISDFGCEMIRKVSAATGDISTVAGGGSCGSNYCGDGGPATDAELYVPYGIALDTAGNIYIADSDNSVIRKVTAATGIITTVAGNGKQGYSGDGGLATNATLLAPYGVALDTQGNLYITDQLNNVIREVNAATGIINTVVGNGVQGYSGDDGPATSAALNYPSAVALDTAGNVYFAADPYRVRSVASSTATAPLFVPAGGTFTSAQAVTLVDITPGSTIHYTNDGTTPSASSPVYTSPITVSSSTVIHWTVPSSRLGSGALVGQAEVG